MDLQLPKASQESPLPLATRAALPGQEVAPSAPRLARHHSRGGSPCSSERGRLSCPGTRLAGSCLVLDHGSRPRANSTTRQPEGTAPPLPAAAGPGAQAGKDGRCQAPLTHPAPSHRQGKAQQSQRRPFFPCAKPTAAIPGGIARPVATGRPRVRQRGSRGCGSFSRLFVPRTGQERTLLLDGWQLLGRQQLVGDAEGGEEAAQEGHQAGEVHGTAGAAHGRRQRPHGQGHQDLRQEVLAAQQGDVNAHPTPRALRLRAYELRGHSQSEGVSRGFWALPSPGLTSWLW